MDKLKFKSWVWPENPETFCIRAVRGPEYTVAEDGTISYEGMGPMCRIISGNGVFQGTDAVSSFNSLSVMMASGSSGELVHPVWGKIQAYLTGLEMKEESRENYIVYSFTFREVDESGMIPPLPEYSDL